MCYNEFTNETLYTSTKLYAPPNHSPPPSGTRSSSSTDSHKNEMSTPSNIPFYRSSFQPSIFPTASTRFIPTIQSPLQPKEINCGAPTLSLSDNPKPLPSKDHMHDQNVLQIKDSTDFLSDQPNSKSTSTFNRDNFMLSTVQPSLVPSYIPSLVTIFEPIHIMRSPPGLFP